MKLNSIYLREAEEESHATAELKGIVDGLLQLVETRFAYDTGGDSRGVDFVGRTTGCLKQKLHYFINRSGLSLIAIIPFTHITRNVRVLGRVESAALERILHLFLHVLRAIGPSLGRQIPLLVLIDRQAGAGHGELNQEEDKEYDHVEEEQDLVVPNRSGQAQQRGHQQDYAAGQNTGHYR